MHKAITPRSKAMKTSVFAAQVLFGACRTLLLTFGLLPLLVRSSPALTITDNFTNPANWGPPLTSGPDANLSVSSGRMNYTASATNNAGAVIPRLEPLLPTTQDWSLRVDVHVDAFPLTTVGHFTDVFLGFGKTGDWFNNHVIFEFDRGWWSGGPGYDIGDNVSINGVRTPDLFTVHNLSSPDAALRMDYAAANHSVTYYFDSDGAANGYNWTAQGTANLASGTYNLSLGATDTFTVILVGSAELQTVAAGQAYLSNLVISVASLPDGLSISSCHPVADTPQSELAVSSAFDGTNFLVGIRGHTNSLDAVGAQLLSPAGSRVGGFINVGRTMDGFLAGPRVAFGATNYLMVWTDAAAQHPPSGNDIYAQFISPAGDLVGSAFSVSTASDDQYALGVACDGTNFLVVWSDTTGFRGRRLSPAGQLLGGELVFTTEDVQEAGAVAFGGGQYFVSWVEGIDGAHSSKGRLVSSSGQPGNVLNLSQADSYFFNPVSVAFGHDRFLAVWHHNADANAAWDLRGRLVMTDGTLPGDEFVLTDGPADELAWANNVVFNGQHFLVSWTEAENPAATNSVLRGQYWGESGEFESSPFVIEENPGTKLGLGLSSGAGSVLTLINTGLLQPEADVCAKLISRRSIAIAKLGPSSVEITFAGVLQYSTNLTSWADYLPQPVSPWTTPTAPGARFFRTR